MARKLLIILFLTLFAATVFADENDDADKKLYWQGYELEVVSVINDRYSLAGYEWPEAGYLVQFRLAVKNKMLVPDDVFATYSQEFVLLDGERVYRPFDAYSNTNDETFFTLTYKILKNEIPVEKLKLDIWRRGALWANAHFRGAAESPFKYFISKDPKKQICAIALEDGSMYRYDKSVAVINPDEAFKELNDELKNVINGLRDILSKDQIIISDDPDQASVVIGVNIQYPLAGKYGTGGAIKAYNCVLTLTAYDAKTHNKLAALTVGSYFGNTISIQAGATAIWKYIPSPDAADDINKNEFIFALRNFWKE